MDWEHFDRERVIFFGNRAVELALQAAGGSYVLLSTPRSREQVGIAAERATTIVDVPAGPVDVVATELIQHIRDDITPRKSDTPSESTNTIIPLVAVGGGRVIDVAKALAAADPPRAVVAIPTTLSGAEMTSIHRHVIGAPPGTMNVRPLVVGNDPRISASLQGEALWATAANAYAHAIEALVGIEGNPISNAVAARACNLIDLAVKSNASNRSTSSNSISSENETPKSKDEFPNSETPRNQTQKLTFTSAFEPLDNPTTQDTIALGALLAGWALDQSSIGLHHALAQTVVRLCSSNTLGEAIISHAKINATLLPFTTGTIIKAAPKDQLQLLDHDPISVTDHLREMSGADRGLTGLGASANCLEKACEIAAHRPELSNTPPRANSSVLKEILAKAS